MFVFFFSFFSPPSSKSIKNKSPNYHSNEPSDSLSWCFFFLGYKNRLVSPYYELKKNDLAFRNNYPEFQLSLRTNTIERQNSRRDDTRRQKNACPQHRNAMALLIISRSIIGNIQNYYYFFLFLFQNWGRSLRYFLLIGTSALSLAHDNAKLIETRRTFLPNTGERLNRQVKARQCTT